MTELENLRLALRNAQTMPLSYCEDDWEQAARDRRETIDGLQRKIARLHRREELASRKRYDALLDDFAAEVRRDAQDQRRACNPL